MLQEADIRFVGFLFAQNKCAIIMSRNTNATTTLAQEDFHAKAQG